MQEEASVNGSKEVSIIKRMKHHYNESITKKKKTEYEIKFRKK